MSETWQTVPFGEMAMLRRDTILPSQVAADTPYIGLEHIEPEQLRFNGQGVAGEVDSQKSRFEAGDILFGKLRPYFRKVVRPRFAGVCSTDLWVVRSKPNVEQGFLYYVMADTAFVDAANQGSGGTRMPRADWDHVTKRPILLPPISEQRAIARVLGSLDDKIECNRRMNATLEQMARALFKAWFVDFEPFGGEMPNDWQTLPFSETAEFIGGGTPKTTEPTYWNGAIPWFSVVDAPAVSDVFVIDTEKHITEAGLNHSSTKLLPVGTSIISARGTVGRCAIVGREMAMNQSCYAIRGKSNADFFTYYSLLTAVEKLKQHSHGSVFDTITRDTFRNIFVTLPNHEAVRKYNDVVTPLLSKIKVNGEENRMLAELRETLLPRLLSRELAAPIATADF